jgi:HD-GYP domain-containing protein (c-di-GMP phosphodiesterase class II)
VFSLQGRLRYETGLYLVIVAAIVLVSASLLAAVTSQINNASEANADQLFGREAARVEAELGLLFSTPIKGAAILADQPAASAAIAGDGLNHPAFPIIAATLRQDPNLYSGYIGRADGSFLQIIPTHGDPRVIGALHAPSGTGLIVRAISAESGGARVERWTYFGGGGARLGQDTHADPAYDPRTRPWYLESMARAGPDVGQPYLFSSIAALGVTASQRLPDASGVVGFDLTLTQLNRLVGAQRVSPRSAVILTTRNDRFIGDSHVAWLGDDDPAPLADLRQDRHLISALLALPEVTPPANRLVDAADLPAAGADRVTWPLIVRTARLFAGREGEMRVAIAAPFADFNESLHALRNRILIFAGVLLLVSLPASHFGARRLSRPLKLLTAQVRRIQDWDFSGATPPRSAIREFAALSDAFESMKETLLERTQSLERAQDRLTRLIETGIALAAERDSNALMRHILSEAKSLTRADGGTLYIRGNDQRLSFRYMLNDTLGIGPDPVEIPSDRPAVPMLDAAGRPNHRNVVSHAVHRRASVNIADAYDTELFDFSGTRDFDARNDYRSRSMLTIPLMPQGGEVIGAIQLINAKDPATGAVVPFALEVQRIAEALASVAATSLFNRMLLDAQDKLMDSLIQITAGAIDTKSPYTGGHCERVPELAMMLARAACDVDRGPLADFNFATQDEWREFQIGAWLHDCGKVTTPEHIVDKATKLEAIYNRIHEVRTRFEVLLRDSEIAALRAILDGADSAAAWSDHRRRAETLHDEFAFVAGCNVGSEFLSDAKIERIREIGRRTWLRYFDDRLGLSHLEAERLADIPAPVLPASETLLADKPEHRIKRGADDGRYPEHLGFKMKIPEHLYDLGEIHNLSISRGTLTEEDRFKINEHIIQTLVMLDRMPFPAHLRRVPEYAGTHHETISGTGYPRRLAGDELSIPARIVMIADIFEALTASDRPYKKAKSLSEAITILAALRDAKHIDADLFGLFLTSGVYRDYAARFLQPEQIDTVDVTLFLASRAPGA